MPRYKRSKFVFFSFHDRQIFDLEAFLNGQVRFEAQLEVQAWPVLTGAISTLTKPELDLLTCLGEDWSEADNPILDSDRVEDWVRRGLILSDADDEVARQRRRDEEILLSQQWHPAAALYHFMARGTVEELRAEVEVAGIDGVAKASAESASALIERFGLPPGAFHNVESARQRIDLPLSEKDRPLYSLLRRRNTVRTFDRSRKLELETLSTLLFHTFGCHGYTRVAERLTILQKTSPSGGSMHPVEAYPLVMAVEGLEPGFYHYNVEHHRVDLICALELSEAEHIAEQATNGQGFVGSSHVAVFLTARFYRNFWKYRRSMRTYSVILMDAAHLSQTFYLVATELGLGAFFTASINPRKIESVLGIDSFKEGVLGVCGCGLKPANGGLCLERSVFKIGKRGVE